MPENRWPGSIELGKRIAEQRKKVGVSRQELANLANIDVSNLSRIENGSGNPGFYTIIRIAACLGIDPGPLVSGIGLDQIPPSEGVLTAREWASAQRAERRARSHQA